MYCNTVCTYVYTNGSFYFYYIFYKFVVRREITFSPYITIRAHARLGIRIYYDNIILYIVRKLWST